MLGSGIPIAEGWHSPFSLMSCPGADKLSIPFRFLFSQTSCSHLTKTALSHSLDFSCGWALVLHPPVGAGVLSLRRGALHVP